MTRPVPAGGYRPLIKTSNDPCRALDTSGRFFGGEVGDFIARIRYAGGTQPAGAATVNPIPLALLSPQQNG